MVTCRYYWSTIQVPREPVKKSPWAISDCPSEYSPPSPHLESGIVIWAKHRTYTPTPLGGHGPYTFPSSTTISQQKSCPQPCPPRPRWAFCTVLIHPPAGGTWSNLGFLAQPPPTHLGGHVQREAPPCWGDMIHVPPWAWVFHLRLGID